MSTNCNNAVSHEYVISALNEIPGRDMILRICQASEIWHNWTHGDCPEVLFYLTHGEFAIGHCGDDSEIRRMDAVISVRPPHKLDDSTGGCLLGFEIKTSVKDLDHDTKLAEHYLKSGICDYYYLIAANDDIAIKALAKYKDNYHIGVASFSSGRVFKNAGKCIRSENRAVWYQKMLSRRKDAPAGHAYHKYYEHDRDVVMLVPQEQIQKAPILQAIWQI